MYAQIALPIPLDELFDYQIPTTLLPQLKIGCRVKVPFGHQQQVGFCVNIQEVSQVAAEKVKEILSILDPEPVVTLQMLSFSQWWAKYYHCSLGEALETTVPYCTTIQRRKNILIAIQPGYDITYEINALRAKSPSQAQILELLQDSQAPLERSQIRSKLKISLAPFKLLESKGFIKTIYEEKVPDLFAHLPTETTPKVELTPAQQNAFQEIQKAIELEKFKVFLLFGVTGSGKTEIYLRTIELIVQQKKEAIVLVPEIALTPQTVIRFKQRFPNVAVLHSELSNAQRAYQWEQIHAGKIQVVIGPRSAIFAPTHHLGLIVVDEEHEPSFKQQNTPRYHARDLAVKRGQEANAIVILGSATPSLETYHNCLKHKYIMLSLPERIGTAKLPQFSVVNMKEECQEQKRFVYLSRVLIAGIEKRLAAQQQVILFLNRRGFATNITCPVCGYEIHCPHCEIPLTYHKQKHISLCHYCNFEAAAPTECPSCHFQGIRFMGIGTERIEASLRKFFPNARIHRMDSDTMVSRQKYEDSFLAFSRHEIDILLGTQMIAKGLDFPKVTLVGIISADTNLQLPDFRSSERAFQLIVQVAGRAGRGETEGEVILQTWQPDHYAIQFALTQNYTKFAEDELKFRQELSYPPFSRLLRILIEGPVIASIITKAEEIIANLPPQIAKSSALPQPQSKKSQMPIATISLSNAQP